MIVNSVRLAFQREQENPWRFQANYWAGPIVVFPQHE
jgi:hypothetical protein